LRQEGDIAGAIKQFAGLLQQGNAPTGIASPPAGAGIVP
jgi:hypothetical protein